MDQNTPVGTGVETTPAKKNSKSWIVGLITILVVGGFGAAAFGFLQSSDPMTIYMSAEKETMEEQWSHLEKYYGDEFKLQDRMYTDAYDSNGTITAEFDIKSPELGEMNPMIAMVKGVLSTASIEVDQKMRPSTKEAYVGLDVILQGNSLANFNLYQNDSSTAAKIPFLYEKYFALENDKLGEFLNKMGEPAELTQIPNIVEMQKNQLTYVQMKEMISDYMLVMAGQLKEEQFSLEKGVTFEGNKYDKITISLSEKEAEDMIVALLLEIKQDERIWSIYESQFSAMNLSTEGTLLIDEMKTSLNEVIDSVDEMKLPKGIVMEAYIGNDIIAHRNLSFDAGIEGEEEIVAFDLKSNFDKQKNDRYASDFTLAIEPREEKGVLKFKVQEEGKPNKDGYHVESNITVVFESEVDSFDFGLNLATDYTDTETMTTFDIDLSGLPLEVEVSNLSGFVKSNLDMNKDEAKQKLDFGFDVAISDPYMGNQELNVVIHFDQDIKFTEDISFPTLSDVDTLYINELSEAEMEQIGWEIESNLQQYYGNMFGMFGGFGF